ncbi:MAG: hypothetical protein JXR03_05890 [Cyclobacteriaceae bacterium]
MWNKGISCILYLTFLVTFSSVRAQQHVIYVDSSEVFRGQLATQTQQSYEVNKVLRLLWKQGHLFAKVNSSSQQQTNIEKGAVYPFFIQSFLDQDSTQIPLNGRKQKEVFKTLNDQIAYWSNKGYPFASLKILDIRKEKEGFSADLRLEKGPMITYDTVFLINRVSTSKSYIEKSLDIERGELFNENSYRAIEKTINRLPYLSIAKPPDVAFEKETATIYLDLKERNSNSFEGVVGLLPGQSSGDLLITGYIDLQLNNLFKSGKAFSLKWNRFAVQSQSLDLDYSHPFFLDTRILFDFDFSLFKQDTTFLNQQVDFAMGSYIGSSGIFKVGYSRSNANLISTDQDFIELNNVIDYKRDTYNLSFGFNNYDYPFGFSQGWKMTSTAMIGQKKIEKNPNIDPQYYDSIIAKSNLLILKLKSKYQKKLYKQLTLYQQIESSLIFNNQLLNNELSRLGGLQSVRGFNENFFFASQYLMSRLEIRQYLERESYFMLFYDQLFFNNTSQRDYPFGLGLGLALSTNNSLFNFAMAVGKSKETAFNFSNAKIHFGYTSRF